MSGPGLTRQQFKKNSYLAKKENSHWKVKIMQMEIYTSTKLHKYQLLQTTNIIAIIIIVIAIMIVSYILNYKSWQQ